jgi:hypothetical protein
MAEELRERVMRDVSTVEWPDGPAIRKRAVRRRARRVVAGCAAVAAVLAVAWTALPLVGVDGSPRPAEVAERAPGMLRGEDVGPGFRVYSWADYRSTEGGRDGQERVVEWPPAWLTGCPAYAAVPPAGFRGHRGGSAVRADPPSGTVTAPVKEFAMRFADGSAAGAVLDEAREIAAACASFDVGGRSRYTARVAAEDFAGDDAVRLDLAGVGIEHATGGQAGVPGLELYVLVRVGRVVILLTSTGKVDGALLQDVAPAAVRRLCAETDHC